ncbi:outer membrane lipoprotein carrier protein LolA [Burkholderia singularis]|uniref:Outer-membrane lipoprotein carrier protein n=1 Tax=Burkholderia singularis TaxID=1503053 RepID=A0A103DXB0_9BURK|nr:outer membrane lipoprotein chaperone LolA [Burkholderia singularis]KVE24220.1 outer membrane lipoprotein carrier protein LolA [Burkholderia singularis]
MQDQSLAIHSGYAGSPRAVRRAFARTVRAALAGAALALAASHAFASGTEQLKAFVSKVRGAKGEFTQQIVKTPSKAASGAAPSVKPTDNSSGSFEFSRPGKFIWSYQKPYQQVLQADGDKLYVYDKDLNQVTERKLAGALGASPAAILFGSNDLEKNYTLRDAGEKGGIDWLEMLPKAQDTQFQRIGIGFKNGVLAAMELHDVFGNVTLLTFTNIQTNPPFKADEFKFVVPKGADVVSG